MMGSVRIRLRVTAWHSYVRVGDVECRMTECAKMGDVLRVEPMAMPEAAVRFGFQGREG